MNFYHGISDVILALVGLYVFFKYLQPLAFSSTILWESFVLSVVGAAVFGALGFFGWDKAVPVSQFFQTLATINGGIGLIAASAVLVLGTDLSRTGSYAVITLGFVLFALYEVFTIRPLYFWIPVVAMGIVLLFGLIALLKGKVLMGTWIVVGVAFFALGSFRTEIFGHGEFNISLYHLLMAGGVLSLGMANAQISQR
jgi:hypothetical protein